jgi:GNAT superfamily N-acetyltransferase
MRFDYPREDQIPQLRQLWKKAFGDTDAFLDIFFSTAFSPRRCRYILLENRIAAALYWFDVRWNDLPCAYIYAVATDPECRGQGLCRALMEDAAHILEKAGYDGALLVPQDEGLRAMYEKMGYLPATRLDEFHCAASDHSTPIRELTAAEYAADRRIRLPALSVLQEGENLTFLSQLARFYKGDRFLAAVSREPDHLRILEYLGDSAEIGPLIAALGHREATVRTPGERVPFAMYRPLSERCIRPNYFSFCFD